jgi:hypothetical protein
MDFNFTMTGRRDPTYLGVTLPQAYSQFLNLIYDDFLGY